MDGHVYLISQATSTRLVGAMMERRVREYELRSPMQRRSVHSIATDDHRNRGILAPAICRPARQRRMVQS